MASWCREPLGESEFKEFFEGPSYIGSSAMTSQKKNVQQEIRIDKMLSCWKMLEAEAVEFYLWILLFEHLELDLPNMF